MAVNKPKNNHIPFFPLKKEWNGRSIACRARFSIRPGDNKGLNQTKELIEQMLSIGLSVGGMPYLSGWFNLTHKQKMKLYGEDFISLQRTKAKIDPDNILNPGVWI